MNRQPTTATLRELWMIKDETAARFQTAAAYFEHLGLPQPLLQQKTKATTPKTVRKQRTGIVQAY